MFIQRRGTCQGGSRVCIRSLYRKGGDRSWAGSYRKHPVSSVKRAQFMMAPSWAVTARSAQGCAVGAVMADLESGRV
eukprot:8975421-Pyramimonas_sp.AAC.1